MADFSSSAQQYWLDFEASQEAIEEASYYHPRTGTDDDWAFFSVLQRPIVEYETPWGDRLPSHKRQPLRQNSYPLHLLPEVLTGLDPMLDSYISQAEFTRPNRRAVNFWRVGVLFVDLDVYQSAFQNWDRRFFPHAILSRCDLQGWPRPSLILSSGRGFYLKWFHDALPRAGLPRWVAIERHLVQAFADFGADPKAKDISRVLRIVGTTNSKSGNAVEVLHIEPGEDGQPIRYRFEYLAECFLPKSREQIAQERIEREAKRQAWLKRQEERIRAGKVGNLRQLAPGQLNWDRLCDLQKLSELRKSSHGGSIPDGQREPLLFWQVDFMLLSGVIEPEQLWFEAQALARDLGMTDHHNSELSTLYAKAKAHRAGEKVEHNGKKMSPLYTPRNQTLIDWLEITSDEERQLRTIISEGEARRRARERDRARKEQERRQAGRKPQGTREARLRARWLVNELGKSIREAAMELGVSVGTIHAWTR